MIPNFQKDYCSSSIHWKTVEDLSFPIVVIIVTLIYLTFFRKKVKGITEKKLGYCCDFLITIFLVFMSLYLISTNVTLSIIGTLFILLFTHDDMIFFYEKEHMSGDEVMYDESMYDNSMPEQMHMNQRMEMNTMTMDEDSVMPMDEIMQMNKDGIPLGENIHMEDNNEQVMNMEQVEMDKMPMNDMDMGKMPMDEMPMDEMPMDEMPMNEMPMDEMPMNEMSMSKMPMDEMPIDEMPMDKMSMNSRNNMEMNSMKDNIMMNMEQLKMKSMYKDMDEATIMHNEMDSKLMNMMESKFGPLTNMDKYIMKMLCMKMMMDDMNAFYKYKMMTIHDMMIMDFIKSIGNKVSYHDDKDKKEKLKMIDNMTSMVVKHMHTFKHPKYQCDKYMNYDNYNKSWTYPITQEEATMVDDVGDDYTIPSS